MNNFYQIHCCEENKFRVYLNASNSELLKKFNEINRNDALTNKFVLVLEAVKKNIANTSQWNWEDRCDLGDIYAIKVNEHRFYTIVCKNQGYRELYIGRYAKKESQTNDKSIKAIIEGLAVIDIQKRLT